SIANRRYGDRYLFGGYKSTETPFDMAAKYYGGDAQIEVQGDKPAYMAKNIHGSVVFMGRKAGQAIPELPAHEQVPNPALANQPPVEGRSLNSVETSLASQGTSSVGSPLAQAAEGHWGPKSVNIFEVMTDLEFGLRANDKVTIQN